MKMPNLLKRIWWMILVVFFTWLVAYRFDSILNGNSSNTDLIIFLIWVALLASPLFKEINLFGVGFKHEFENFKNEVRGQIFNLRTDIQQNTLKAEFSQNINILPLPADSELPSKKGQAQSAIEETLKNRGIVKLDTTPKEPEVPKDIQFLFSVRYAIENELRRIWRSRLAKRGHLIFWSGEGPDELERVSNWPVFRILNIFADPELSVIISQQFAASIKDTLAICSAAIHGEKISKVKVDFVREVAPGIIASLKTIE